MLKLISNRKKLNPNEVILIVSDPRSGSTWLSEVLQSLPRSLVIDEPLHIKQSLELVKLNFSWRQHIPRGAEWPEAYTFFSNLFSGKQISPYSTKGIRRAYSAKQLIIKSIRAKLLLPWLCDQFDFKYKPIVLVRHPMATIVSLKEHQAFNYPFKPFTKAPSRYSDVFDPFMPFLSELKTNAEQQLALWCISNKYLSQQNAQNWLVIKYEDLLTDFENTLMYIFNNWGINRPEHMMQKKNIPSSSTSKEIIEEQVQLNDWTKKISEEELMSYQKILDYFSVDYDTLYT